MEVVLGPKADEAMNKIVQGNFNEMTFKLKNREMIIETGQPTLPGNVIDFGNAAVLAVGVKKAQMIVDGINDLAEQFQEEKKALK